jgi:hypothetical protein
VYIIEKSSGGGGNISPSHLGKICEKGMREKNLKEKEKDER